MNDIRPHAEHGSPRPLKGAVRLVALFEAFKGLVVLLAATGVLALVHKDLEAMAVKLVRHAHLDPAAKYPEIFIAAAGDLQNTRLTLLALGAAAYSALRFIEAFGLLRGRAWPRSSPPAAARCMCRSSWSGSCTTRPRCVRPCSWPMRRLFWSWFLPSCSAASAPRRTPPDPCPGRAPRQVRRPR